MTGFMDGVIIHRNELYFEGELGYIVRCDLETLQASLVSRILEKQRMVIRRWILEGEDVYLVANEGYSIVHCVMSDDKLIYRAIYMFDCNENVRIKEAFKIKNQIWCIPSKMNQKAMIMNMESKTVELTDSLAEFLKRDEIELSSEDVMTIKCVQDRLYWTLDIGNDLLCYDVNTKKAEVYHIGDDVEVSGFELDEEDVWFRAKHGISLHRWNQVRGIDLSVALRDENELEKSEINAKIIRLSNGKKVLLPTFSNTIAYYDDNNDSLIRIRTNDKLFHKVGMERASFTIGNIEHDGKLWIFPWASDGIIEIDIETMEAQRHLVGLREAEQEHIDVLRWHSRQIHHESDTESLEKLIRMMRECDGNNSKEVKSKLPML